MQHKLFLITAFALSFLSIRGQSNFWKAPASVCAVKNPIASCEASIAEGKKCYMTTCAPCHGNRGKGDGVAAIACTTKPADHTSKAVQDETDGAIFWKITTGHGQMISYKSILSDEQRWKLVLYIRTLAIKK